MKNMLWYLGFLSLLSLLYFVEWKTAFLWFLCFIPYFGTYNVKDERIEVNTGRATRNAFAYTIFFGVGTIVYIHLTGNTELFAPAFVALFGGSLLVGLISLFYYDKMRG
ncbi:MAG: hypothetical protein DRP06_01475 [Candidatus Aenigmatarchaeota archaeon]|nr:MAG: hypothetical protein DRP06_01475 [Candidatus Aenigmarchaeota archaeon]